VKKRQDDSDAWYYLGLSLHRAGKIKDALKAFEKTLSLSPDFAPGYAAMAYMQLLGNENKGAVMNAEKAFALDPKNFESLYISGLANLRQGAPAVALAKSEDALKIKPDSPQALILKTQALINMFSQERAKWFKSPDPQDDSKSTSEADGEAKRRDAYSLLKTASESLEAYLKLTPEQPQQAFWREQLEAIRFYAQRGDGSPSDKSVTGPDKSVTGMSANLRPKILYRERAHYTDAARNAGVWGTVILMVVFADDGALKHILVIQGLSHGLTEEAISAARKIRFTPAMRDGKPVSTIGSLEFSFNF
jgi:tetratricopeptide (TPR) repeat protein